MYLIITATCEGPNHCPGSFPYSLATSMRLWREKGLDWSSLNHERIRLWMAIESREASSNRQPKIRS